MTSPETQGSSDFSRNSVARNTDCVVRTLSFYPRLNTFQAALEGRFAEVSLSFLKVPSALPDPQGAMQTRGNELGAHTLDSRVTAEMSHCYSLFWQMPSSLPPECQDELNKGLFFPDTPTASFQTRLLGLP